MHCACYLLLLMSFKQKWSYTFSILQRIGQSLMVPVSVLPAAGLLVALGRLIEGYAKTGHHPFYSALAKILFSGGLAIFEFLPMVFAIGVAIGFTNGAGVAGLAAAVGYFTMANVLKVVSEYRALELAINTGVFGGIAIGFITARLYNRYYQTRLHPVLGFFSGKRLVPILSVFAAIVTGLVLGYGWPPIQNGINEFGKMIIESQFGPAFYAAGKRLLIPVGLHHVYYPTFLYDFGSFINEAGQVFKGDSARYFAGDPSAGRFMASEFPLMLFGLPAAALAMVLRARPERRKAVAGVMLSAALTSIITGITEPVEFAFIFVAPILYVFHVLSAFGSGLLTAQFDIHLGYTFSASAIDYALGFFNAKNSFYFFALVGPAIAGFYFAVFYFAIGLLDLKTPGREEESLLENSNGGAVAASQKATEVLKALGGAGNIKKLDACITRLRVSVSDSERVNGVRLKELGAAGVMNAGGGNLQVVFGVESEHLKEEIQGLLSGEEIVSRSGAKGRSGLNGARPVPSGTSLSSPLRGRVVALKEVPDATFSEKLLGDGVAIEPEEGVLYSPCDGEVVNLFHTGHAIGIRSTDGAEVLIHIGLDTVKLAGKGFKPLVKEGDSVRTGQALIEFDIDFIQGNELSIITPVVITNSSDFSTIRVCAAGTVKGGESLLQLTGV